MYYCQQMEGSLADLIMEMGYGFCSSVDECRNNLVSLGAREISPVLTARVLSMMIRTHTGLDEQVSLQNPANFWGSTDTSSKEKGTSESNHLSTWNVEIFVQVLKEMV